MGTWQGNKDGLAVGGNLWGCIAFASKRCVEVSIGHGWLQSPNLHGIIMFTVQNPKANVLRCCAIFVHSHMIELCNSVTSLLLLSMSPRTKIDHLISFALYCTYLLHKVLFEPVLYLLYFMANQAIKHRWKIQLM